MTMAPPASHRRRQHGHPQLNNDNNHNDRSNPVFFIIMKQATPAPPTADAGNRADHKTPAVIERPIVQPPPKEGDGRQVKSVIEQLVAAVHHPTYRFNLKPQVSQNREGVVVLARE